MLVFLAGPVGVNGSFLSSGRLKVAVALMMTRYTKRGKKSFGFFVSTLRNVKWAAVGGGGGQGLEKKTVSMLRLSFLTSHCSQNC